MTERRTDRQMRKLVDAYLILGIMIRSKERQPKRIRFILKEKYQLDRSVWTIRARIRNIMRAI